MTILNPMKSKPDTSMACPHKHLILPTPTVFLTSLINSLTTLSRQQPLLSGDNAPITSDLSKTLPSTARPLLLTLHVLFPHILLDALDLLDRGLITCLTVEDAGSAQSPTIIVSPPPNAGTSATPKATAPSPETPKPPTPEKVMPPRNRRWTVYHVRSAHSAYQPHAQPPRHSRYNNSRSRPSGTASIASVGGEGGYQVHLTAWNCSCPAFAFAAFATAAVDNEEMMYDVADAAEATVELANEAAQEFVFMLGGLARPLRRDGGGEGVPPVCKHLLACVLAERCAGFFKMRAGGEEVVGERKEGVSWIVP